MPVDNYGVWKGHVVRYTVEQRQDDPKSPQLSLYFHDQESREPKYDPSFRHRDRQIPGLCRAAINVKSGEPRDSRLVYWVNHQIDLNPLIDKLDRLDLGFHPLDKNEPKEFGLDYIRNSLFNTTNGRLLPHDIPGQFSTIIDVLEPNIKQAADENATVYVFGSRFHTEHEIHNIHMNQGNSRQFHGDDGVYQDGSLLFHFKASGEWLGVFLAFASQAVHTDDKTGHAISGVCWSDILRPDIVEESVVIQEACVNPPGPGTRRKSVTLSNRTNRSVYLDSWSISNMAGDVQMLPRDAALKPRTDQPFEVPNCRLSDQVTQSCC
ncbi:hypothetical protein BJY04DRAFT_179221 [Aspergillus karnatakaensis]|uniref:uncharacterized protein n=1 Tax=Aspergillus karnatakaensis TaxID=1810916 RepID=UPI003CCD55D7